MLGPWGAMGVQLELECVNSLVDMTPVPTENPVGCSVVETGNVVLPGVWLVMG